MASSLLADAYRTLPGTEYWVFAGPPKFDCMLALYDGDHYSKEPRISRFSYRPVTDEDNKNSQNMHAIVTDSAIDTLDCWFIAGVKGYQGAMGFVEQQRFILSWCPKTRKGRLKFFPQ